MLDLLLPIDQIQAPKKNAQPTPKSGHPDLGNLDMPQLIDAEKGQDQTVFCIEAFKCHSHASLTII
ncbi:MAG: hypothetical protein GY880_09605 [Planctomycetaceae bacterium]|nr:hypothetical protein [Planctomycetaceae bacterium]